MSKCISNKGEYSEHEFTLAGECSLCGYSPINEIRARALEEAANSVAAHRYENTSLSIPIFVATLRARAAKIREGKL